MSSGRGKICTSYTLRLSRLVCAEGLIAFFQKESQGKQNNAVASKAEMSSIPDLGRHSHVGPNAATRGLSVLLDLGVLAKCIVGSGAG